MCSQKNTCKTEDEMEENVVNHSLDNGDITTSEFPTIPYWYINIFIASCGLLLSEIIHQIKV